ncbi:MAG: cytochrome C [Gammaproteobacteria bacterium]|nr:cytochrome C [Gammaproteobacteria bacterium]
MKEVLKLIVGCLLLSACSEPALQAPSSRAAVIEVPTNWAVYQKQRTDNIALHIEKHKVAYARFADFPVSQTHGVPYLLLKLLPKVAPEFWPDNENFLSVVGLYKDERNPGYPVARGIGFSGLSRDLRHNTVDAASFTCGGCHIGRVKDDRGKISYLDGGINSEFSVIGFRKRMVDTFSYLSKNHKTKTARDKAVISLFIAALDKVEKELPGYFYNNYRFEDRLFDEAYEKNQIKLFRENASKLIPQYVERIRQVYNGWRMLVEKNYPTAVKEMMDGYGGMEDAIGFNTVDAYLTLKKNPLTNLFAGIPVADVGGQTDIMAVWDQQQRNPRWNAAKDDLIDGGGQWNGHIPLPIYKNIAAQLTLGVENIDVQVSAFSDELLDQLPAAAYPFELDVTLARKGQKLFEENCQICHQANNGKVYNDIGTHPGRAVIADSIISWAAVRSFTEACSPELTVIMHGKENKPCGMYKGVSLKDKAKFAMTRPARHAGYNALPLAGIWAQAPYLHNGSIPTMYHLLMPQTRPERFIKSRLSYDKEKMGFKWEMTGEGDDSGYLFDTTISPALSNTGHDKDIIMNNNQFRLNWDNDESSVRALIEYMKVL